MCGLLGLAYHKDSALTPELAGVILSQLMYHNEGRGGDSFGLGVVVPDEKDIRMYKTVGKITKTGSGEPSWAHGVRRVMDKMREGRTTVAIGHNRKATTGANTVRNAHPFLCGKADDKFVFGAHNGIVSSWRDVANTWEIQPTMQVDSEIIFRGIHKFQDEPQGDLKVLGQLIPMSTIASTYMKDLDTLNLYRGDNPLSIAVGDGFVFWSSMFTHLVEATFGLNVQYPVVDDNTVLRLDLNNFTTEEVDVPKNTDLQKALFPRTYDWHNRGHSRGSAVVKADRRSSTYPQREDVVERLFRQPSPCDVDGPPPLASKVIPITQSKQYRSRYPDRSEPSEYTVLPRDPKNLNKCCVCHGYTNGDSEPDMREDWELLWHGGEALCTTCYYYMVQADAEASVSSRSVCD